MIIKQQQQQQVSWSSCVDWFVRLFKASSEKERERKREREKVETGRFFSYFVDKLALQTRKQQSVSESNASYSLSCFFLMPFASARSDFLCASRLLCVCVKGELHKYARSHSTRHCSLFIVAPESSFAPAQ